MRLPAPSSPPDAGPLAPGATPSGRLAALLVMSSDGYLRLTLSALRSLGLRHLFSGLDEDRESRSRKPAGASLASILGFTEWVTDTTPAVSLGWDWRLNTLGRRPRYVRDSEVRSNVMLIEPGLGDLGDAATSATLAAAIDAMSWEAETNNYISNNFGWHLSNLTVTA
jgi:uncharacterized protein DUF4902